MSEARDKARFLQRVEVSESGCWLWRGRLDKDGYGRCYVASTGTRLAHRRSYELHVGPIPEGLETDHVKARGCAHRHCVNPAHLEPVTHQENVRRGGACGRGASSHNAAKTHCANGHPFDEANTYKHPNGRGRSCRKCNRESVDRYNARLRSAR